MTTDLKFGEHLIHLTFGPCSFVRSERDSNRVHVMVDGTHTVLVAMLSDVTLRCVDEAERAHEADDWKSDRHPLDGFHTMA
jgi:hypothetical protein